MRGLLNRASPELRAMVALTGAEGFARALSFVFYIVAARALGPDGFGIVLYTLVLSQIAISPATAFGAAFVRRFGAARINREQTVELLDTAPLIALGVLGSTMMLCLLAALAGLTGGADVPGLLVATAGLLAFQLYYGIARGAGEVSRLAIAYVGGSILQLAVLGLLVATSDPGPRLTLVVYGVASVAPILLLELYRRFLLRSSIRFVRSVAARVWSLAGRLLLVPVFNLIWFSADVVWVEGTLGSAEVGRYGAAKNLMMVFMVLVSGAMGVMAPRVSELRARGEQHEARRFVLRVGFGLVSAAAILAALMILLRVPLLRTVFGPEYEAAAPALIGLAVSMVVVTGVQVLGNALVSWERTALVTGTAAMAAVLEITSLLALGSTATSAAWINAGSAGASLLLVLGVLSARPLRDDEPVAADPAPSPGPGGWA